MRVASSAWIALLLSLPVSAQSTSFTMPPGFLTKYNTSATGGATPYCPFLGAYAEGRMQVIGADWTGSAAVSVTSISLRRDSEYYYPAVHGKARSWTRVSVQMSDSDYVRVSATFSANVVGTPTTVFSAAVSFADTSAKPSRNQAWGGFNMRFPFASPFAWSRKNDVCIDFQFAGGKLANNAVWRNANYVMIDGFSDRVDNGPYYNFLVTQGCNAPGQSSPGFFGTSIRTNGPRHARPNTIAIDVFQVLGAPLTSHIGAIGLLGNTTGIDIGPCEKLYLLHTPVPFRFTTNASGSWFQPASHIPFATSSVGLAVYSQSAYTHPLTKNFALSGGVRSVVPALPKAAGFKQVQVNSSDRAATTGSLETTYVPILKFD